LWDRLFSWVRWGEVKVDIDKAMGYGDTTYECGVYFEE
jgi:hypothetical protein